MSSAVASKQRETGRLAPACGGVQEPTENVLATDRTTCEPLADHEVDPTSRSGSSILHHCEFRPFSLDMVSEPVSGYNGKSTDDIENEQALVIEEDFTTMEIDVLIQKLPNNNNSAPYEFQNETYFLPTEQNSDHVVPEQHLDNLNQFGHLTDDMILAGQVLQSLSTQPSCNISNRELIIRLQENEDLLNQYNGIDGIHQIRKQKENTLNGKSISVNSNIHHERDFQKFFLDYVRKSSRKDTNSQNCQKVNYNTINCIQTRSKSSRTKSNNTSQLISTNPYLKPRFHTSMMKRRKNFENESDNCITNKFRASRTISKHSQTSKSLKKSVRNNISTGSKYSSEIQKKKLSSKSANISQDEPESIPTNPWLLLNHQEMIVTKALKSVGITNNILKDIKTRNKSFDYHCHINKCDRQFIKLAQLKHHLLTHFNIRPFKCDIESCSLAFYSDAKLKRHQQVHQKKKDYVCPVSGCKRRYSTNYSLSIHEKWHSRQIVCEVANCAAKFQNKQDLERHMKIHDENLAPYVCNFEGCGKRFYGNNNLAAHQRTHSHSVMDMTCSWPNCGKTFDYPCKLKLHMRSHTGSKPYVCSFNDCKWAFSTSSKLSRHQKKHSRERKFVCDIEGCKRAFMRTEHLKKHKLIHGGKRLVTYQCDICSSAFNVKRTLCTHIKEHNDKDYASKPCRQFQKKTNDGKKTKENLRCKVQPIRLTIRRAKNTSVGDFSDAKQKISNSENYEVVEQNENISPKECISTNSSDNQDSKIFYSCSVDNCTKKYRSKSRLRTHLHKKHACALSEIQNGNVIICNLSDSLSRASGVTGVSSNSINDSTNQITETTCEIDPFTNEPKELTILEDTLLQASDRIHLTFQDVETSIVQNDKIEESSAVINQGSARTAFTRETVFFLKPNRKVNTSDGTVEVVLSTPIMDDDLLLSEDLSFVYCDDIEVPEYQILMPNATHSLINLQDFDYDTVP